MRKPLTLLAASTALSVVLSAAAGLPGWSATPNASAANLTLPGGKPAQAMPGTATDTGPLVLAGDDDDDDDDDLCDDDDDDDDGCGGRRTGPAPAGTVMPPANGLFGTGAPPQVKVN